MTRSLLGTILLILLIFMPIQYGLQIRPQPEHESEYKILEVEMHKNIYELADTRQKQALYDWVFAVYLDGDNNLESAAIDDFLEMSSVGSTSNVVVVVLFDRCIKWNSSKGYSTDYGNWTDARIFKIDRSEEPWNYNADEVWGEVNMGNPQTLFRFINYTVTNYPAEKYALILWDHGSGYFGACQDEDNGNDNLDLSEIKEALGEAYSQLGIKIDLLGFDACLMGNIEVAYEFRDYVDVIVFSQEYEPGDGWPYDSILSFLTSNPTASVESLATTIVNEYINFYSDPNYDDPYATLSAINITYLVKHTFAAINRVAGYLLRYYSNFSSDVEYALSGAETSVIKDFKFQKDLKHFFILLRNRVSDSTLISLLDDAIREIENSVIAYGHLSGHPNAYGLSAYIHNIYRIDSYFNFDSSSHHQWDEFIRKLLGEPPGLWFYDIKFYGHDFDGNGAYGSSLKIEVDLDSSTTQDVYIKIYGHNGTSESLVGETALFTVSGASPSDAQNISITISSNATYSFRLEIWDTSGIIKGFYYFCDANITDVPLETREPVEDIAPPTIEIISPENNSIIYSRDLTLEVSIDDNIGISHVEVYINGSLAENYTIIPTKIYLMLPSYGIFNITIVAVDKYSNVAKKTLFIEAQDITPPTIRIISSRNNSIIYELSFVLEINVSDDGGVSYVEIYLNGNFVERFSETSLIVTIDLPSFDKYVITIIAEDKYSNRAEKNIVIEAKDIEPPKIQIISPENNSVILGFSTTLVVDITDNSEVNYVEVYINDTLIANYTGTPSQIGISFPGGGTYVITIVAVDIHGNLGEARILLHVQLQSPKTPLAESFKFMGFIIVALLILIAMIIVARRK